MRGIAGRIASGLERASIPSAGVSPIFAIGVMIAAMLGSSWLLLHYTTGDAAAYNHLFSTLKGLDPDKILFWQNCVTTSREPLYGLISWAAANLGISRTALMIAANGVLIGLLALWLWRNDAPWTTWLLLFANYYVLVMFATADRFKLAVILLLGALVVHRTWAKGTLVTLSLITHLQSIMLVGAWLAGRVPGLMASPRLRRDLPLIVAAVVIAIACAAAFAAWNWHLILVKFGNFSRHSAGLIEGKDFVLLIAVGLVVGRDRPRVVLTQLPLLILATFLGDQRMTVIGIMLLFQQIIEERRTGHPLFILLMAYAAYKSIGFVENVLAFGNGFLLVPEYQPHPLASALRRALRAVAGAGRQEPHVTGPVHPGDGGRARGLTPGTAIAGTRRSASGERRWVIAVVVDNTLPALVNLMVVDGTPDILPIANPV